MIDYQLYIRSSNEKSNDFAVSGEMNMSFCDAKTARERERQRTETIKKRRRRRRRNISKNKMETTFLRRTSDGVALASCGKA